jgi:hypothetical protein
MKRKKEEEITKKQKIVKNENTKEITFQNNEKLPFKKDKYKPQILKLDKIFTEEEKEEYNKGII